MTWGRGDEERSFCFISLCSVCKTNLRAIDRGREKSTACSGFAGSRRMLHKHTQIQVWLLFEQS